MEMRKAVAIVSDIWDDAVSDDVSDDEKFEAIRIVAEWYFDKFWPSAYKDFFQQMLREMVKKKNED